MNYTSLEKYGANEIEDTNSVVKEAKAPVLALTITKRMTVNKFLAISIHQFPYLQNGGENCTYYVILNKNY